MFKQIVEGLDGRDIAPHAASVGGSARESGPDLFFGCTCGAVRGVSHEWDCAWWDAQELLPCDAELPGLWSSSDLVGGWTDCEVPSLLRRQAG